MKTLKKPLIALLALAVVLSLAAVIAVAASPVPQGSLEEFNALIAEVEAASTAKEKKTALTAVNDYLQGHEFSVIDVEVAQEKYDEIAAKVSNFTVEEVLRRLAAVMDCEPKQSLSARLEVNSVQSLLRGEGYISADDERYPQLYRDAAVVDAFVDLLYIGRDDVEIIERGETLRTFFEKTQSSPLDEKSVYYAACMEKYDTVVDATVELLYGTLRECLAVAESAEATEEELLTAVSDFRALCERCYFKTEEAEYIALCDRNSLAEMKLYMRKLAAETDLYEKGVLLQTAFTALIESGMARNDEEDTASDKALFFASYDAMVETLTAEIFAEVNGFLTGAMDETRTAEERAALLLDYKTWTENCYFPTAEDRYTLLVGRRVVAEAFNLLFDVKAAADPDAADRGIVEQNKKLKTLVEFYTEKTFNNAVSETATLKTSYDALKTEVMTAFYVHLRTLTDLLGNRDADFDAARAAKETILALAEEGYYDTKMDAHKEYLAALAASERTFGERAIEWAKAEFKAAMEMTDTAAKKLRVEEIEVSFTSHGIAKIENATEEADIAFNAEFDTYTDSLFYARLDLLADDALGAYDAQEADLSPYFTAINEHLASYSYDKTSAEWAAYTAKVSAVQKAFYTYLIGEADRLCTVAEGLRGREQLQAFNRLKLFYNKNEFERNAAYYAFLERYEALSETAAETLAEIKAALEAQVPLSDYGLTGGGVTLIFENGGVTGSNIANGNTILVDTKNGGSNSLGCMTINYKSSVPDTYYTWSVKMPETVAVFEMDVTTFGELPPTVSFTSASNNTDGARVFPAFFRLKTADGKTNLVTDKSVLLKEDILTPGVWTHIAMVYNDSTKMIQMYVDYEKAGEAYRESTSGCTNWTLNEGIRMGGRSSQENTTVSFDNLTYYFGSVPRNTDRFTNMPNDEKFLFFGEYVKKYSSDPTALDISDVNYAYSQMNLLLPNYWSTVEKTYLTEDAELRAAVDAFRSVEQASIHEQMKELSFAGLKELRDALFALPPTTGTIASREEMLESIDTYIELNSASLDQSAEKYKALIAEIEAERAQLSVDKRVAEFEEGVTRFRRATSLVAMTRHYATCKSAYGDGFDAVTLARFTNLPALVEEYEGFYTDLMAKTREANAKTIVECMKLVAVYSEDEYEEKYDEINIYIVIVRGLLVPNEDGSLRYQQNYLGVSSAVKLYNRVNDFFYQKLQLEHIEKLKAQIDKYASLDSYIEKLGVVKYVHNYLATNDVDRENAEIRKLLEACSVYEQELGMKDGEFDPDLPNYQLEKYEKLIEQNTVYFVDTVARMALIEGYSELKAMYDSVMEIYYYMNIDAEEVQAALAVFNSYEQILRDMEMHSKLFIKAMEDYALAETATDKYKALSRAYSELTLGANEHYDGIADTLAAYKTAAEAYNTRTETVTAEISATVSVMCSARADFDGVKYVIAAFKKRYD